jgi:ABC-2 type transport system permease protein
MGALAAIVRREAAGMLTTPVAWVFMSAFAASAGLLAFQLGGLFESGRADLAPFFQFHPWLHAVFMPALAMRSWAEDTRSGTLETLLSLPVPLWVQVLGKFLALWGLAGLALMLTVPLWIGIAILGPVDHGATLAGYFGSWLVAGGCLAIASAMSAATSSQVTAYVLGVLTAFAGIAAGLPLVGGAVAAVAGRAAGEAVGALSILDRFEALQRGSIELDGLVFFASLIACWLAITTLLIENRRAGGLR